SQAPSERDIVVEIIRRRREATAITAAFIAGISSVTGIVTATGRTSASSIIGLAFVTAESVVLIAVVIAATTVVVTTAAAAVEHLHLAGNNFRGVTVLAILSLPLACAQAALDINLRAFFQVF